MPERLIQIADSALADSYARAGDWMACHPGCDPCCHGVFAINVLDAARLRAGLRAADPTVRADVTERAAAARARLAPSFPGNARTGELFAGADDEERALQEEQFEEWANDEPCPVLNPVTHTCDLYDARPMLCRTFGPPMPDHDGGFGVCELCFRGAPPAEVARCAVDDGFLGDEAQQLEQQSHPERQTIIAWALQSVDAGSV